MSPSVMAEPVQDTMLQQFPLLLPQTTEQLLPNPQSAYSMLAPEPLPMQAVYSGDGSQYMPDIATTMATAVPISQPSMDDYIRTADEMSGYLTWQTMEIPPWLNLENLFPPG